MKKAYKIALIVTAVLIVLVLALAVAVSPVTKNYVEKHDRELLGTLLLFFQIVCFPKDSEINFFTSGSVPPKNNKVSQFASKVPAESLYNALICDLS